MSEVVIEFRMDAAYYAEFHSEWIAARGRGWRIDRWMIRIFVVAGLGTLLLGLVQAQPALQVVGAMFIGSGLFERLRNGRRRARWLMFALSLPWSGKMMRIEVEDGELVQRTDLEGDPRFWRTHELRDTPNGYLFGYQSSGIDVPSPDISSTAASVYIPHRAIQPPMSRAEFRALLRYGPA